MSMVSSELKCSLGKLIEILYFCHLFNLSIIIRSKSKISEKEVSTKMTFWKNYKQFFKNLIQNSHEFSPVYILETYKLLFSQIYIKMICR